jgi:PRC-barrel domain
LNNSGPSTYLKLVTARPAATLAERTADIIGTKVKNRYNEDLGKVEEVLIDATNNRIGYLILSFCGFLGMGERRYAVPWKAMQHDNELNAYVLNVTHDQIRQVASVNEETRPAFTDVDGKRKAHVYCELPHFWMP